MWCFQSYFSHLLMKGKRAALTFSCSFSFCVLWKEGFEQHEVENFTDQLVVRFSCVFLSFELKLMFCLWGDDPCAVPPW